MTLRHRLLLVNGVVVVLSVVTVGVAIFELTHARQVSNALQLWNEIVLSTQKLRSAFPPENPSSPGAGEFLELSRHYRYLNDLGAYMELQWARDALSLLRTRYTEWQEARPAPTPEQTEDVRRALDSYAALTGAHLENLKQDAAQQDLRRNVLLFVFGALILLNVTIIGSLLRRWLLLPMQQLNRQVEALGRDRPPEEPLVTFPQEMAKLAHALDQARRSLGSLRQQLIESERLTTIGQLAAQLAHNLRNPLASIRAAAQVSARHTAEEPVTRTRMEEIIASVDRMNEWIAGLMEFARPEPTPPRELDVVPTMARIRESVQTELAVKELSLELQTPSGELVCAHDPATLEHALYAMMVNAIEASPLGGRITLSAERITGEGGTEFCRIAVADGGPGLPDKEPDRIFEFSYSTKQRGMGLGLALARCALERQGGSAHAMNRPEGGALVYVDIPLRAAGGGVETPLRGDEATGYKPASV